MEEYSERQNLDNKGEEDASTIPKEKPEWLKEDCIKFYDKVNLSEADSETLLKWFQEGKYNDEFKVEGKEIKRVFDILKNEIGHKDFTTSFPQERFGSDSTKIFWNHKIMKKYVSAFLQTDKRRYHFKGPQNLGKTFTLIYFRNLLCTNEKTRVIYIHDLGLWFENPRPIKYLLDELQFTFADRLKEKDYQGLDNLYKMENKIDEFHRSLEKFLTSYDVNKFTLIIDQYNALEKHRSLTKVNTPDDPLVKGFNKVENLIQLLQDIIIGGKIIYVSSMTDEALMFRNPNENLILLSDDVLDSETCRSFIEYLFGEVEDNDIEIIRQSTGNFPGEISNLANCPGNMISERIVEYEKRRLAEIKKSLAEFKEKRLSANPKELDMALKEVASILDLGFSLSKTYWPYYINERYIHIDYQGCARSYFPVAGKAFRIEFYDRTSFRQSLYQAFCNFNRKIIGDLFEMITIHEFCQPSNVFTYLNIRIRKHDNELAFSFGKLTQEKFVTLETINFNENKSILYVPPHVYFEGVDFVIFLPATAENPQRQAILVQCKYRLDLYKDWKPFHENTYTKRQFKDLKPKFVNHCKESNVKYYFVLMFLLRNDKVDLKEQLSDIKKDLSDDVYICDAQTLPMFDDLEKKIVKL